MSTRDVAVALVARKVQDIGSGADGAANVQLSDTEIGEEVDAAVIQYSVDHPRQVVVSVTGTSGSYYPTSTITGWIDDWSRVVAVEFPITTLSATESTRQTYIDPDRVLIVRNASGYYLYLGGDTPTAAQGFLLTYTTTHTLTAATDTIPVPHFDAVCDLAAAYCARRLASKYAKSSDSTISADSVNYRDSQLRFRQVAEDFEMQYRRKVGLPESGVAAASSFGDWDVRSTYPYAGRLTHWPNYTRWHW